MKILAITQARYGSTRLPAKILKKVNGQTLLEIHLKRILQSKTVSKLKIATTDEEGSKYIMEVANKIGVDYFKGSVDDVLSRFYGTAVLEKPDYVIRLTSDCPLIDPNIIDTVVTFALEHPEYDYVHTDAKSFPDGLDTEIMKFSAIEKAYKEADLNLSASTSLLISGRTELLTEVIFSKPIIIRIRLAISMQMTIVLL